MEASASASSADSRIRARTVLGDVPVAALGITLPHEHVVHRISIQSGNPDNACTDTRLEFDLFGWEELAPDARRFQRVAALVREGLGPRLLLSTDTCRRSQLHRHGGRGFDYLFRRVLPGLREAGVPEKAIQEMTVVNPARFLSLPRPTRSSR